MYESTSAECPDVNRLAVRMWSAYAFTYSSGITISNPDTTVYLCSLDISRPSNHIGIIRAECGSNTILTYHSRGEKKPFYGMIKSTGNINKLLELKKRILAIIEH